MASLRKKKSMIEKIQGRHKLFIAMSFCSYFVLAFPNMIHGSVAPVTMEYYGITTAQQGLIVTMQSFGFLGAAIFIALKGERYNKMHSIAFGLLILSITGLVIGGAPPYAVLLVVIVFVGIGLAFIDTMMNGVIPDVFPKQKNTLLPLTHAFFSVGATVVPVIATSVVNPGFPLSFSYPFRILAIAAGAVFILYYISSRRIISDTPYINMDAMKARVVENPAEVFKTGKAWYFLITGILYFTFQTGTVVWLPTFVITNTGATFETGGMMLTALFAGMLIMRFLCPLILKKISARNVYIIFGWVSAAMMLALLFVNNIPLMLVLVVACGFFQGSHAASLVLMCCDAFPERTASASAIYTIAGGIASITAPLWMGIVAEYTGFLFPLILISIAMLVSATMIFFLDRKGFAK